MAENNYLSRLAQKRRDILHNKEEKGTATQAEKQELVKFERDDQTSDYLADSRTLGFGLNGVYNPLQVGMNKYQARKEQGVADSVVGDEMSRNEAITDTVEMTARGVSPYLKHQQSEANKYTEKTFAKSTALNAGCALNIHATGGDMVSQGSQISLQARDNVMLTTAQTRQSQV